MRLVVFEQYRRQSLGTVEEDGRILDLSAAAAAWLALERRDPFWKQEVELRLPADVGRYLVGGAPSRLLVQSAIEYARAKKDGSGINGEPLFLDPAQVRLSKPLVSPLVLSPGAAFHCADDVNEHKPHREFFMRNPLNVAATGARISIPQVLGDEFNAAPRLAVVIGSKLHRATEAEASEAVFGYCLALEIKAREVETISWAGALFHVQYPHARSYDGALTLGAAVVTRDQIGPPQKLGVRLIVDGRNAYTGTIPGRWSELFEWMRTLSERVTLQPGTLLIPGGEEETYVKATHSGSLPVEIVQDSSASAVRIARGSFIILEIDGVGTVDAQVLPEIPR